MSTEILSPVDQPSLLYPALYGVKPRRKDYRCKRCGSDNQTCLRAETKYFRGGNLEDVFFDFECGCGNAFFVAAKLLVNEVLEEQMERIFNFTKVTGKEFGALVIRTVDGDIILDMFQIGENREVEMVPTHEMREGEEILGTFHCIVAPTTSIETENGKKRVTNVKIGDRVLSLDGEYHRVLNTFRHNYTGKTIQLVYGFPPKAAWKRLSLTEEHEVLVSRNNERIWVKASEIQKTDKLLVPEYKVDRCESCGVPVASSHRYCSIACMALGKSVEMSAYWARNDDHINSLKTKLGERLKIANNYPEYREKIKKGCIKRSLNPEYRKKLSEAMKRSIALGRRIMPEGFKNEETQRKAQKTLIYTKRHGSAWEAKVYEYLLSFYEEREVKRQFEVLGSSYPIKNQFGSTSGTKRRQYFLDIALPDKKVDIEIDGEAFHKNKERDQKRDDFLRSEGWNIIRIPVRDVSTNKFTETLNREIGVPQMDDPPVNFVEVPINDIKTGFIKDRPVYNLEVEGSQNFVAGCLVHNCHPVSETFSLFDLATMIRDKKWEKISMVAGADGSFNVAIPTSKTPKMEDIGAWLKENENMKDEDGNVDAVGLANKYNFLLYRGKADNLKLISADDIKTYTLEDLFRRVSGVKNIKESKK